MLGAARADRLPARRGDADDEGDEHQRRGADGAPVTTHELDGPIERRILTRENRQTVQVPSDIAGELLDRLIAALAVSAECHEHDRVEIALQAPLQTTSHRVAWPRRIQRRDDPRDVRRCAGRESKRRPAGQQLYSTTPNE